MKCVRISNCPYAEIEEEIVYGREEEHCKNTDCALWMEYEGKDEEE